MKLARALSTLLTGVIFALSVGVGGLAIAHRVRTGAWDVPTQYDLHWARRTFVPNRDAPRVVYVNRDAIVLRGGMNDSFDDRSSLVSARGIDRVTMPGFSGSDVRWDAIMACVDRRFRGYDVRVTDERPLDPGYIMAVVGGHPVDLGIEDRLIGGISPMTNGVVHDAVVFVFADQLHNDARTVCETIAHEVGHAYGLDHTLDADDIMSYLPKRGTKSFVDQALVCGEQDRRDCDDGSPVQNSHRKLLDVLGARPRVPQV